MYFSACKRTSMKIKGQKVSSTVFSIFFFSSRLARINFVSLTSQMGTSKQYFLHLCSCLVQHLPHFFSICASVFFYEISHSFPTVCICCYSFADKYSNVYVTYLCFYFKCKLFCTHLCMCIHRWGFSYSAHSNRQSLSVLSVLTYLRLFFSV